MKYLALTGLLCRCQKPNCYALYAHDNHCTESRSRLFTIKSPKCPYSVLKIKPGASMKETKAAYYEMSKQLHPDIHGNDPTKSQEYLEVQEAYSKLMQTGINMSQNAYTQSRPGGPRAWRRESGGSTDFEEMYYHGVETTRKKQRSLSLYLSMLFVPPTLFYIYLNRLKHRKRREQQQKQMERVLLAQQQFEEEERAREEAKCLRI